MKKAYELGIRNFFLQLGTYDDEVEAYIQEIESSQDNSNKEKKTEEDIATVILDCVMVQMNEEHVS